jgi:N4-gp56 family major capsid protein
LADTSYSTLSSDAVTYIAEKTLSIAKRIVRFYDLADKAQLPSQNSKTFQYTRYDRLPLPTSTLTEGTTPTSRALSISTVSATAEQWGDVVTLTDVAELTIRHKPLQKAIQLLGFQSAETIEREIYEVLMAGTTVYYPGSVTSRIGIDTTDVPTADSVRKVVAALRANGAMGMERPAPGTEDPELGDLYVCVVDSYVEQDIASDPDFIDAVKYAKAMRLWEGEIGTFLGCRFIRSNSIPTLSSRAAAAGTATDNNGTLTTNYYYTSMVVGIDDTFGYEKLIFQSSEDQVVGAGNDNHISLVVPTVSGYTYFNIYMSAGSASTQAAGAATMYLQNASGPVVAGTYLLGYASESGNNYTHKTTGTTAPAEVKSASSKIHTSFFLGKEAYTVVDLQNLQSTLTPNVESDSDPLKQRRKAGWKVMFKAVINNNDFFARLESESAYD